MFPYTAEETEWLSAQTGSHYWLLGQGELTMPAAPANDDTRPQDRRSAS
jgi:hypothetical protein